MGLTRGFFFRRGSARNFFLFGAAAAAAAATAAAERTVVTFDYNWRFHLGDPIGSKLTTASRDPSFENITGSVCTQLAWSQLGRMLRTRATVRCWGLATRSLVALLPQPGRSLPR